MPIQFYCVSCGKPVEVDDAWAGRLVECPFCHETVTAPAFSTANAPEAGASSRAGRVPQTMPARSSAPSREAVSPDLVGYGFPEPPELRPPGTNKVAIAALILAITALVVGFAATLVAGSAMAEALGTQPTPEQVEAYMQEAMKSPPPWAIKAGFAFLGAVGLWVAGLVCGIVAVCKPPRGLAVAAMIVLALPVLLMMLTIAIS